MRDIHPPSPSVVVGIDGSRSALTAALWAVDEAVDRDIPLRLVCAIEPREAAMSSEDAAHALATAEIAVRHAFTAVEATDKPVKVEVEILQGRATDKLLQASRAAAMLCVGVMGTKHATAGRVGSTAAELATRAQCPVAIIRGFDPSPTKPGSVLVEVDASSESDVVLQRGIDEALLRNAPLVVVSVWQPHLTDNHDGSAVAEQDRRVTVELNRRLQRSIRRHPGLDARPVAVHGSLLDYLSHHAQSVQLVVVGRRRTHGVAEMVGPPSYVALHGTDCSVLVCDPHNPL
jgi:nucleotide-binding universal stress UspA family protein